MLLIKKKSYKPGYNDTRLVPFLFAISHLPWKRTQISFSQSQIIECNTVLVKNIYDQVANAKLKVYCNIASYHYQRPTMSH